MTNVFPNLPPEAFRELDLSDYGVIFSSFFNGHEVRTSPNTTGSGSIITLEYRNRTAIEVGEMITFYHAMKGSFRAFSLPNTVVRHKPSYCFALGNVLESLLWKFTEPLRVETVYRNSYNMNIKLTSVPQNVSVNALTTDSFPCMVII